MYVGAFDVNNDGFINGHRPINSAAGSCAAVTVMGSAGAYIKLPLDMASLGDSSNRYSLFAAAAAAVLAASAGPAPAQVLTYRLNRYVRALSEQHLELSAGDKQRYVKGLFAEHAAAQASIAS